jgi:formylglycine-generating enzyme required for sulfatase activity
MRCGGWGASAALALLVLSPACEAAVNLNGLDGGCPPLPGPTEVKVSAPGGTYCIDSTEVTNAQYADFLAALATSTVTPTLGAGCPAMTNFTPVDTIGHEPVWPTTALNYPVVHVNWCDAYAYCAWAGKRLCGAIGGGSLMSQPSPVPQSMEAVSEWLGVCSGGGATAYPYGSTYETTWCNGTGPGGALAPVASNPQCVGGYPGVYDMSGNVWEWTDACTSSTEIMAFCSTFGGAFDSNPSDLTCLSQRWWYRTDTAANIGFRCCQDL